MYGLAKIIALHVKMARRLQSLPRYRTPAARGFRCGGGSRAAPYDRLSEYKPASTSPAARATFLRVRGEIKHARPIWHGDFPPRASFIDTDLNSSRIGLSSRHSVNVQTEPRTGFVLAARIGC